jgi:HAD superfamily hydrolase (TIGR01509 family)
MGGCDQANLRLSKRGSWIFDMDGTLTVAVHDFDFIRRELGLEPGSPILEHIVQMPEPRRTQLTARLDELELEFALMATCQPGIVPLLDTLRTRAARMGIVTRNSAALANETLRRCGLTEFFDQADIVGRDEAVPKPAPDGIELLLSHWQADARDAVMVGDFVYDLEAGRNAGVTTVYYDPDNAQEWSSLADVRIQDHFELRRLVLADDNDSCGEH